MESTLFPVMNQPPQAIPLWIAQMAYKEYSRRFGTRQSLERLGDRGGFGQMELIDLLACYAQFLEHRLRNNRDILDRITLEGERDEGEL